MSVVIQGALLPYRCADCEYNNGPIYDCGGEYFYCCTANEEVSGRHTTCEVLDRYETDRRRPEWCPMEEGLSRSEIIGIIHEKLPEAFSACEHENLHEMLRRAFDMALCFRG